MLIGRFRSSFEKCSKRLNFGRRAAGESELPLRTKQSRRTMKFQNRFDSTWDEGFEIVVRAELRVIFEWRSKTRSFEKKNMSDKCLESFARLVRLRYSSLLFQLPFTCCESYELPLSTIASTYCTYTYTYYLYTLVASAYGKYLYLRNCQYLEYN